MNNYLEVMVLKININSKFNIGQNVYCLDKYRESPICNVCNGDKKVIVTNSNGSHEIECPNCNGTGRYGENELIMWKVMYNNLPWKIDGVFITLWKDKAPEYAYSVTLEYPQGGFCSTVVDEDNCFNTIEEALLETEKRNADPETDWD